MHLQQRSLRHTLPKQYLLLSAAALIVLTAACYIQVYSFDFIYIDDDVYVIDNPLVRGGFTAQNMKHVFTSFRGGIWMPLTTLSFMADYTLYGLDPGGYHITNLMLHCANTVLLFLALFSMTGALWKSFFVAALFGVHPLHVESVAWITERKDVLSTFFFMLCLLTYRSYVRQRGIGKYAALIILFCAGLMAKPMLVTLPAVLLVLDWWPLQRFYNKNHRLSGVLAEKIPLFAISAAAGFIAYSAQQHGESLTGFEALPLAHRVANALNAYGAYLLQTAMPRGMGVLYPHPGLDVSFRAAGFSSLALILTSAAAIRLRHAVPALLTGWLWFLGTLAPVIGLIQIGAHARADRFMYIPLIGIGIAASWGLPRLLSALPKPGAVAGPLAAAVLGAFSVVTAVQVSHWKNSVTLFTHTLQVTENNFRIHNNLGHVYYKKGLIDKALEHFARAVAIKPSYARCRYNYGVALRDQERFKEALGHFSAAVRLDPGNARYRTALGGVLFELKQYERARTHFVRAMELNPDSRTAVNNYAGLLVRQGALEDAAALYRELLKENPGYATAHYNLGAALYRLGRLEDAAEEFQEAIRNRPRYGKAYYALGTIRYRQGQLDESVALLREARTLMPGHAGVREQLQKALKQN